MLEHSLRKDISIVAIGNNSCQTVPGSESDECPDGFGPKTISSRRRHQAVPDLDGAVLRLPFEPGAADCLSVCDPGDQVEVGGTLVAKGVRGTHEHGCAGDIAVEGKVRCPRVIGARPPIEDASSFHDVDGVQDQPFSAQVGSPGQRIRRRWLLPPPSGAVVTPPYCRVRTPRSASHWPIPLWHAPRADPVVARSEGGPCVGPRSRSATAPRSRWNLRPRDTPIPPNRKLRLGAMVAPRRRNEVFRRPPHIIANVNPGD